MKKMMVVFVSVFVLAASTFAAPGEALSSANVNSPQPQTEFEKKRQVQLKSFDYKLERIKKLPQPFIKRDLPFYKLALKASYNEAVKRGVDLSHILIDPNDIPDGYRSLDVISKVHRYYLELHPEDNTFLDAVIGRFVKSIDKEAAYITREDFVAMQAGASNKPSVGLKLRRGVSFPVVAKVMTNSPAMKAGVMKGDKILSINGESVKDKEPYAVEAKLKGEGNTSVELTLSREGITDSFSYSLKRTNVVSKDISHHFFETNYCYIQLNSFSEIADDKAVREILASKPKLKGLIVDLRGNPGGILKTAIDVTDLFVEKGDIVKIVGGREMRFEARQRLFSSDYPIIILVDHESAGASEIFSASLQYNKKALIMGNQTYGGTLVQSIVPFSDGTAIKFTSSKFIVSSGEDISGKGVTPDIEFSEDYSVSDSLLDVAKELLMSSEGLGEEAIQSMIKNYKSMKANKQS